MHPDDEMAEDAFAGKPPTEWGQRSKRNATTFKPGDPRAAELGKVSSPAKVATARANGAKGGKPAKAPADRECTCGLGDAILPLNHKSTCPRRRAWKRQEDSMFA